MQNIEPVQLKRVREYVFEFVQLDEVAPSRPVVVGVTSIVFGKAQKYRRSVLNISYRSKVLFWLLVDAAIDALQEAPK